MKLFNGGVKEAIAEAKAKQTVFVVIVTGPSSDEASVKLDEVLADSEIISRFSSMVCIKLENGSPTCSQFAAIYPVIIVPSVYFIDSSSGVDIEITGGVITKESLLGSFSKVSDKMSGSVTSDAVKEISEETQEPGQSSSAASTTLQDRVERAKMLVEQRKAEKEVAEGDKEKSKEMERREVGKAMLDQKRRQEEKELRDAAVARRKDKEEERLARERVKAQLEQDKLDKRVKFQAEKVAAEENRREKEKEALAAQAAQAEIRAAERATTARIQFRLPDGSSQTQHFPADTGLSELYTFARTGLSGPKLTSFSLSTAFPRRNLDTEDMAASLKDLQMAPSATVMVLPSTSVMSSQDGGLMSLVMLLLTPFTLLWSMISSFFGSSSSDSGSSASSGAGARGAAAATHRVTREAGIGRLRSSDFSDDDMNTWNGNSTQQQ